MTTGADGKLTGDLPVPTRSGYTFNGWYTAKEGGEKIEADHEFTENTTVYAHWSKKSSGGSSGGSGGSSGGGGGSSGGNTTTKTDKKPDGTTTTTVTNKKTGTVTTTTKAPDGSKTVVETQKDGTTTTKETAANGDTVEKMEKPDGSSETKMNTATGTSTTTVDASGKVEAKVELPKEAVAQAAEKKETVTLPMPKVSASKKTETAPTVAITSPADIKISVEVPVEEVNPGTVAVLVHPDGTEEVVRTSIATDTGVALNVSGDVTVKIVDNSKNCNDVSISNQLKSSVDFVSSRELFQGTSENTFSPQMEMTRGMLVTVLFRLDGEKKENVNNAFGDVANDAWYADAVKWAATTGVVQGVGDGSFAPEVSITRETLCVMIYRYAQQVMGVTGSTGTLTDFNDASKVSSWASEAMTWSVGSGIVNGKGDGVLDPQGVATRIEVAAILQRLVSLSHQ